jgi:hypothetical protein
MATNGDIYMAIDTTSWHARKPQRLLFRMRMMSLGWKHWRMVKMALPQLPTRHAWPRQTTSRMPSGLHAKCTKPQTTQPNISCRSLTSIQPVQTSDCSQRLWSSKRWQVFSKTLVGLSPWAGP